jgi:hypothetical protein
MTGTMSEKPSDDSYSEKETARRMDAALKRALNTPHQPHKPSGKPKTSPNRKGRKSAAVKPKAKRRKKAGSVRATEKKPTSQSK